VVVEDVIVTDRSNGTAGNGPKKDSLGNTPLWAYLHKIKYNMVWMKCRFIASNYLVQIKRIFYIDTTN
jgi:hypothetical protein